MDIVYDILDPLIKGGSDITAIKRDEELASRLLKTVIQLLRFECWFQRAGFVNEKDALDHVCLFSFLLSALLC